MGGERRGEGRGQEEGGKKIEVPTIFRTIRLING